MTRVEEAAARDIAGRSPRMAGKDEIVRTLLAEVDRLRALPVLSTCGDCGWRGPETDPGWAPCTHPEAPPVDVRTRDVPPPVRCPLRKGAP